MFRITEDSIDLTELIRFVTREEVGGVATFVGTVRVENAGKRVVAVEYQAYSPMAEKVMVRIGREVRHGFGSPFVAIVHRVGRLGVGEASVAIAAGAAHRREALGAVAYAIERVKQEVPIWKREFYEDGSEWLEPAPAGARAEDKK